MSMQRNPILLRLLAPLRAKGMPALTELRRRARNLLADLHHRARYMLTGERHTHAWEFVERGEVVEGGMVVSDWYRSRCTMCPRETRMVFPRRFPSKVTPIPDALQPGLGISICYGIDNRPFQILAVDRVRGTLHLRCLCGAEPDFVESWSKVAGDASPPYPLDPCRRHVCAALIPSGSA